MHAQVTHFDRNRFILGILLHLIFVIVELYFGFIANSIALLADAVHNASDAVGLCIVWFSYYLAQRQPTQKFTYGFKNATLFAAFINSTLLIFAIANLLWESVHRIMTPHPVISTIVIGVALLGVVINGATALLFFKGRSHDLNSLSIFLDMTLDTLLSVAVVIGGLFIWWRGWYLIDPILGILIALTIFYSIWQVAKESLHLIFLAVPSSIDLKELIADIQSIPEIVNYHDLHVWPISTTETALSVHVMTSDKDFNPGITSKLAKIFSEKYNIHHSTIQLEVANSEKSCVLHC